MDLIQARTRALPSAAHTMERRWGDAAGPQNSNAPSEANAEADDGDDGGMIQEYSCIRLNLGSALGASGSGGETVDDRRIKSLLGARCDGRHATNECVRCCTPNS